MTNRPIGIALRRAAAAVLAGGMLAVGGAAVAHVGVPHRAVHVRTVADGANPDIYFHA